MLSRFQVVFVPIKKIDRGAPSLPPSCQQKKGHTKASANLLPRSTLQTRTKSDQKTMGQYTLLRDLKYQF